MKFLLPILCNSATLFAVILTWMGKEISEIDLPDIVRIFAETNGMNQIVMVIIRLKKSTMDAAKINEIQTSAGHNK